MVSRVNRRKTKKGSKKAIKHSRKGAESMKKRNQRKGTKSMKLRSNKRIKRKGQKGGVEPDDIVIEDINKEIAYFKTLQRILETPLGELITNLHLQKEIAIYISNFYKGNIESVSDKITEGSPIYKGVITNEQGKYTDFSNLMRSSKYPNSQNIIVNIGIGDVNKNIIDCIESIISSFKSRYPESDLETIINITNIREKILQLLQKKYNNIREIPDDIKDVYAELKKFEPEFSAFYGASYEKGEVDDRGEYVYTHSGIADDTGDVKHTI